LINQRTQAAALSAAAKKVKAAEGLETIRPFVADARAAGAVTIVQICNKLNSWRVPAPHGDVWHPGSMQRVLRLLDVSRSLASTPNVDRVQRLGDVAIGRKWMNVRAADARATAGSASLGCWTNTGRTPACRTCCAPRSSPCSNLNDRVTFSKVGGSAAPSGKCQRTTSRE
jgi:hypothetical protein